MNRAERLNSRRRWRCISLALLEDQGMEKVNHEFLGHYRTTDVIAFTYPPGPGDGGLFDGEILVNVERAWAEGMRRRGPSRELALYIAHGCDHLAGNDDSSPAARKTMRRRELRWLAAAGELPAALFKDEP